MHTDKLASSSSPKAAAYDAFLKEFPEFRLTWTLDALRQAEFSRLDRTGEVYVDYMGGSLYPESLVRAQASFLHNHVLGNTHSVNNSSALSSAHATEARMAVLSFFRALPEEYTVVFTANASAALKLVGEAYPFTEENCFVLGEDSHNSVHGIRQFAARAGSRVRYVETAPEGGVIAAAAQEVLSTNAIISRPGLFALTGQSNISNAKNSLSLLKHASSLGYHTLLDAAALAPISTISLASTPVDAMAISFYKMFGFPTGVGALVVKKSFLQSLKRPWFAGGTVDVVQVPGTVVTMAHDVHEQFEDGTINYLSLPTITDGLRFLSAYLPFLPLRLTCFVQYLIESLSALKHQGTGTPVVKVLSRRPGRRLQGVGDQTDCGAVVSLLFLDPNGDMIPNSFIEHAATSKRISLRTGCMCNPGGAAALLGLKDHMARLSEVPNATLDEFECLVGHELGVVRISLGLATNFEDVWRVIEFASVLADQDSRDQLWARYTEDTERMRSLTLHSH
ncbi:PLP-dependent transferase [Punctularia strigosozonata HHB-11173 SS5]|uniref:PLP-dependent transferase n=1 Tax=Punctularia strigosozonata (strain HHB-11173) TaxID=741275 RepID=UPI0004416C5E|nr:PLP-dependent transferase [Punctularia strigosozonata HHB-11173 SS5]EIN06432.1 PLP-dependent transferase [Punctularia strigosozonata HHB-11173 SS5]